jgi:hypothetical protein|tara:strand:+ start:93 stop:437 length:345 start_codon:yes stop_codon:yes gene_type:complete
MGRQAEYENKKAFLCYDFGHELAIKWFGKDAVDALPKNKAGKIQGCIQWNKCVKGGYHPELYKNSGKIETRSGSIVGKALFRTDWSYSYKAEKVRPVQTLVSEIGDPIDSWVWC